MKRNNLIILCLVIIAVCTSLFLPSYLLNRRINKELEESMQAPNEYYNASASSLSKAMSERLSFSQKLDLITGEWPREIQEVAITESEYNSTYYVNLAKDSIADLYERDLYEISLTTDIDNWYTYDTRLFLCTDTTFDTYSAYYWVITFTKYDQSRKHNILLMDDGSVLCAYACPYEESVDILSLYLSTLSTLIVENDEDIIMVKYDPNYIDTQSFVFEDSDNSTIHEVHMSPLDIDFSEHANMTDTEDSFFYITLFDSQLLKMAKTSE